MGFSVNTGGNRSVQRKPATLVRVKLDNTLLTCDKGNFNQVTARNRNRTLVTVVGHTCTTYCATSIPAKESRRLLFVGWLVLINPGLPVKYVVYCILDDQTSPNCSIKRVFESFQNLPFFLKDFNFHRRHPLTKSSLI